MKKLFTLLALLALVGCEQKHVKQRVKHYVIVADGVRYEAVRYKVLPAVSQGDTRIRIRLYDDYDQLLTSEQGFTGEFLCVNYNVTTKWVEE